MGNIVDLNKEALKQELSAVLNNNVYKTIYILARCRRTAVGFVLDVFLQYSFNSGFGR